MKAWTALLLGLLLASPAAAQDLVQAKAFVTGLYAAYGKEPGPDYIGRQAKQVWSPAMLKLLQREAESTPEDEVGALDGDPICNCQDYDAISADVRVTGTGPTSARADVFLFNLGRRQLVSLDLVLIGRRWRVDDVHSQSMPSLVALLNEALKARGR